MSELQPSRAAREHQDVLREHPHAPKFNFESSDLLTEISLRSVQEFEVEVKSQRFWEPGSQPSWMSSFLTRLFREVPYYREMGDVPKDFSAIPTVARSHFAQEIERFVPDNVPLEAVTVYTTSGTSGTSLAIPTDAGVSSKTLVLMDKILSEFGQSLPRGSGKVAIASVYYQHQTLTYPSVSHYLRGASTVKINLHPDDWLSLIHI